MAALGLLVLLASVGTYGARMHARNAFVGAVADEHVLRGVDREGNTLWTYAWPKPYFPAFAAMDDPLRPVVADLDGDGARELYIWHQVYKVEGRPEHNAILYAFDAVGNLRWTFQVTEPIRSERRLYEPPYAGRAVKPVRYDGGKRRGLLVLANHAMYHPGRAMLLSAEGELLREYLHAGHLHASLVDDLDGDARDEIYLLGITNSYQSSDLMVLDPDTMGGASEELTPFQLTFANAELAAARAPERARWVLPRTALSQATEPYSGPGVLARDGRTISVSVVEGRQALPMAVVTYFQLLPNRELAASGVSDNFEQHWNELWKSGVLRKQFEPADLRVLHNIRLLPSGAEALASVGGTAKP